MTTKPASNRTDADVNFETAIGELGKLSARQEAKGSTIVEMPQSNVGSKSTDSIGARLDDNVGLIHNHTIEQLCALEATIAHARKVLATDRDRTITACRALVESAAAFQDLAKSSGITIEAILSSRARLVPVTDEQ